MPITLTGEVERVTYENDDSSFRVLRVGAVQGAGKVRGPIVVVGTFQAVGPGTRVRVTGEFVTDSRHGEQFKAEVLLALEPNTIEGLARYLGSGIIPGVGPVYARRIVDAFGLDSVKVLDHQPERLREVSGLGQRRIEQIKSGWASQRAVSSIMMLLSTHGASPQLALRIYKHYGDRAAAVVQRSPYRLALEVRGIGFKTADRIARSLGIAGDHPERAQAGAMHELGALIEQGNTYAPREELAARAAAMLEIDESHVQAAIDSLWASERVVVEDGAVYPTWMHEAEVSVAQRLIRLTSDPSQALPGLDETLRAFEERAKIKLSASQRQAVEVAAQHRVVVITGGPGVGKTTIVRAILELFHRRKLRVHLAAPTGRAAKRMSEATGRDASTLHRLLEFEPRLRRFQRDENAPLDADAVIVDESSMIDIPLAAALLQALPRTCRLVIVGDADQLPSVGPGALLRDTIDSGIVPIVRLGEIFRQAGESRIVVNAHHILHGEMPEGAAADEPNADFFVIARKTPEDAAGVIRELCVNRVPRRFGFDQSQIQVLTPMHRGPAGTIALNQMLQAALNPSGPSLDYRGTTYRVGDKVMQLRNDYEKEVFNGDLGEIVRVDDEEGKLGVRFDQREVPYDLADLDALSLAYATSIHKSQGSEYPAVIIPLLTAHFVMLSRNLVYTAVTRARKLCVLVADPRALRLALGEVRREDRKTKLAERLREAARRSAFD